MLTLLLGSMDPYERFFEMSVFPIYEGVLSKKTYLHQHHTDNLKSLAYLSYNAVCAWIQFSLFHYCI